MPTEKETLFNSVSKISIDLKNIPALFNLIDDMASREEDVLIELFKATYDTWLTLATDNIMAQLDGGMEAERQTIALITKREILGNRKEEIFTKLYHKRKEFGCKQNVN